MILIGKLKIPLPNTEHMTPETRFRIETYDMGRAVSRGLDKLYEKYDQIVHTHTQLPSTFFVNYESRYETLKYYKLAFQSDNLESRIYFRHGNDIPCIPGYNLTRYTDCADFAEAKEFMVMGQFGISKTEYKFYMPQIIQQKSYKGRLQAITHLEPEALMEACPKVDWLYWRDDYGYEVDPWELRLVRSAWNL